MRTWDGPLRRMRNTPFHSAKGSSGVGEAVRLASAAPDDPSLRRTTMPLIDPADFDGKIHIDGAWVEGGGEAIDVVEPATGSSLGRIGGAGPEDVARATQSALVAQREWAALPHPERAAVLHRAADLWEKHSEEIIGWNTREVGAIGPMAAFAVHVAAAECCEAGSLPSHPLGEILASEKPRLSLARRMPVGVVGVISPFNVPHHPGHPRGRAGPGPRQRRDPEARPPHRGHRRRDDGARLRGGGAPDGAAAAAAGRRRRRRGNGHRARASGSSPSPARPEPVASSASSPAATSSGPTSSSAATPRSSCSTTPTWTAR